MSDPALSYMLCLIVVVILMGFPTAFHADGPRHLLRFHRLPMCQADPGSTTGFST